ncbi:MAG: hypothetical protein ACP5HK_01465 [Acidilobus sp.]
MRFGRRAISDVVAEIILILVVLSVGVALLGYYLYGLSYYRSVQPSSFDQLAYIVPVTGVANGSRIIVVFDTGPYGIKIYSVLLNNTPVNCTIQIGQQNYTLPVLLPASELAEVVCSGNAPASVTIATNSGNYEVRVSAP